MSAYNLRSPTVGALNPALTYIELLTVAPPEGWGQPGKVWEFRIGGKVQLKGANALLRRELYLGDLRISQLYTYRTGNDGNYFFDDVHLLPSYLDNLSALFSKTASTIDKVDPQEGTPISTTVDIGSVMQVVSTLTIDPALNIRYIVSYDGGPNIQPVTLGYFTVHEL
jgi:hypothetical protein